MALTREPVLSWHAPVIRRIFHGLRMTGPLALSLLIGCATAPDGSELPDLVRDAAAVIDEPMVEIEAGEVLAPYDSGILPIPGPIDAGNARDAGKSDAATTTPSDAGSTTPPRDSGTTQPPVDAGTPPPPVDAGSDSGQTMSDAGGGTGQMCSAAPAYPTTTACAKCTCMKCASQVTACYASTDSAKNTQCAAVQACAETNHCTGEACYCGNASTLACAFNPEGACRQVIETAAGSDNPLDVQNASGDLNSPVGRANAIGTCEQMNCKSECGL
jgi:hypothetical protein